MWGWVFVLLAGALLLYLYFLKRELWKLEQEVKELPLRSGFGSRLSIDFRERSLMNFIDALNQMVDAFEDKNRQAKQMEENVKLSIAGLSHDLRTPLTSLGGYVQLLQATTDETKKEHYLKMIEQAVQRLIEMTDHVYDLARIETNQKKVSLSTISLPHLVEDIFLSFFEQLKDKHIEVQFPEQMNDSRVIADPLLLTRVVNNLVQNILRYAKSKVVISFEQEENDVIFSVKNDIKPDSKIAVEKVFTRFYTETASRTNTESSGLGLYLSQQLVEKMGGKMKAEQNGTWFILYLYLPTSRV